MNRMNARPLVCRLSALGVVLGWGGSLLLGLAHGEAAGINTWFVTALSVGITSTITLAVAAVMPDQARIFGLGVTYGMACKTCPLRPGVEAPEEARHLSPVR